MHINREYLFIGRNSLLGKFARMPQCVIVLAWCMVFKLQTSFSECQCVSLLYYKENDSLCFLLAIKSHPGLRIYIMSVKPKKLHERVRFTADVNSGRCAGFSCHVTD